MEHFASDVFLVFPVGPYFFPVGLLFPVPCREFVGDFSLLYGEGFSYSKSKEGSTVASNRAVLVSLAEFSLRPNRSSEAPLPSVHTLSGGPDEGSSTSSATFYSSTVAGVFLSFLSDLLGGSWGGS